MDFKRLQSQRNSMEDYDNVKYSLAHIRKIQNIAKFGTLVINETAPSTKAIICKKGLDVNMRKMNYIAS